MYQILIGDLFDGERLDEQDFEALSQLLEEKQ
jgi:hypothetical protein